MWKKLRKNYKRIIAFMLTVAMTFTNMAVNMTTIFAAAGEEEEALFVVDGLELAQALRKAKKNGEDFDYSSLDLKARTKKLKGQYEKMLKDGNVYQLEMEIDDSYAPDGTGMEVFYNEETDDVIFLFINGSDLVVNFRASIDGYETEPLTIGPNAANVELDDEEAADFIEDAATKLPEKEAPKAEVVGGTEAEDADEEAEDADQADEEKAGEADADKAGKANADESVADGTDEVEDQADTEENGEVEDQTEKETEAEEVKSEEETTEAEDKAEAEEPETEEETEAEDEAEVEEPEAEKDAAPEEDVPEEVAAVTVSLHEVQLVAADGNREETLEEPETTEEEEEAEADEQELEEEKDEDEDIAEPADEDEENESEKKEKAEAPETEKGTEAVDPKADDTTTSENKEEVVDPEKQGNISDSENGDQETADPEKQGDVTDAENPEEADGTEEGKTDETGETPAEGTEAGETVAPADGTAPAETETTAPEEETKEDKIVKDDGEQFLDDTETMGVLEGKNFTAVALWENTMNAAAYRVSMEAMQVVLENIEIPEEPVGPTAYAAETDDASFTVEAPEGAFEEEVELHVEKIEDEDQLQNLSDQAAEAMDEEDSSKVVGFVAYDITFVSVETGEKVEPAVPVKVGMQFKTLPEDVKEEDVTGISVVHVPEEAVADAEEIEETVEAEEAEKPVAEVVETITGDLDLSDVSFDAESFSPYVIYLNGVKNETTVTDFEKLRDAINTANAAENGESIIEIEPEEGQTEADPIIVTETLNIEKNITIKGGVLTRSKDVTIFNIAEGGSLTLEGITLQGDQEYTKGRYSNTYFMKSPIICNGEFVMQDGTIISGFYAQVGGGLCVTGKATLNGGEIRNNTAYRDGNPGPLTWLDVVDGGVYAAGGGVFVGNGGKVIINGTDITNNSAVNSDDMYNRTAYAAGGGIYIDKNGEVILNDGNISENISTENKNDYCDQIALGGGIAIRGSGNFVMNGGKITDNSVSGHSLYGMYDMGGGICIGEDTHLGTPTGKIELNAGVISGNSGASRGGGIYLHNGGKLTLKRVAIKGNEAKRGGGIWFCGLGDGTVYATNGALISDNVGSSYGDDFDSEVGDTQGKFESHLSSRLYDGTIINWFDDHYGNRYEEGKKQIDDLDNWIQTQWMIWVTSFLERMGQPSDPELDAWLKENKYPSFPDGRTYNDSNSDLTLHSEVEELDGSYYDDTNALVISGNQATREGGGIACNGSIIMGEDKDMSITVNKVWADKNSAEVNVPKNITVYLLRDGTKIESVDLSAENNWEHTFYDLPDGYDWSVSEEKIEGWTPDYGEMVKTGDRSYSITITNKPGEEPKPETIDIPVEKKWREADGSNAVENLLDSIIVELYRNGEPYRKVTLNAAGEWKNVFTDLDKSDKDGNDYAYTIKEVAVKGWTSTVDGYTIINTRVPEGAKGNLTVSKAVTGSRGDTAKEFAFTVTLSDTAINGTYGDMIFTNGVAEFTLRHGQRRTASGLPAGITYTVTESDNDGYTVTSTGEEGTIPADGTAEAAFTNYRGGGGGGSSDSSGGNPPSNPSTTTTTTIENPEVPLASLPNETPEPVSIEESEVPLAALLPKTGDSRNTSMWLMLFSVAGIGMLGAALGMKKKGNEDGDN